MRMKALVVPALLAAAALLMTGFFSNCSSGTKEKPFPETVFEEGRSVFYEAVSDRLDRHPDRGRLTAEESAKVRNLSNT